VDGTFTLSIGDSTTVPLDAGAGAATVQAALQAALGATLGDVAVSRDGGTYLVHLRGALAGEAGRALGALTIDGSGLLGRQGGPAPTVSSRSATAGRILYGSIAALTVALGSGDDVASIVATHRGTTTLGTGAGDGLAFVETIDGTTRVEGGAGDDRFVVNPQRATAQVITNTLTLDGGEGSDSYTVNLTGDGDARIEVLDTGTTGEDLLTVRGTAGGDQFLLRRDLVALLNTPLADPAEGASRWQHAERVVYDGNVNAGLVIDLVGGDNHVALDDTSTITTINGGDGDDVFQVGQLYGSEIVMDGEFAFETTSTTRGRLSNGVSHATTINGGNGNDTFYVFRNLAVLQLNGEGGDDTFIIRTFLQEDQASQVSTGSGRNVVRYVVNAPVSIDGGDGFNTVVVIGTEGDDHFVITRDGVWGAGRFVAMTSIQRLEVDGAEGDDTFYVLSTHPDVETRIYGGLGSDTVNVGGDLPNVTGEDVLWVQADDLRGHSGLIRHLVGCTATDPAACDGWDGLFVDGIAADIVDDDEPAIAISESGGALIVHERGETTDSYTITLAKLPSAVVHITISAPSPSTTAQRIGSESVLLSVDGGVTWAASVTLTFDPAGDWASPRTVMVKAIDDLAAEGERTAALRHLVRGGNYDGLQVPNVQVRIIDNDAVGVTILQSGHQTQVTEGGGTDTYTVALTRAPITDTTVRLHLDGQVCASLTGGVGLWACDVLDVTFTSADWAPVTVHVQAVDDDVVEGFRFSEIRHTLTTSDAFSGSVDAASARRDELLAADADAFADLDLRGYLVRIVSGTGAGQQRYIRSNTDGSLRIQGEWDTRPDNTSTFVVHGYTGPVVDHGPTGSVTSVDGATLTVDTSALPTAFGGLSGATLRIVAGAGAGQFRTIASNTVDTITLVAPFAEVDDTSVFSVVDLPGLHIARLSVLVADDDAPGVLITETDGRTQVVEGGATDTYTVVLTSAPAADTTVTVRVVPQPTPTLHGTDLREGVRLEVSLDGTAWSTEVSLTFDADDWDIARTVHVRAIDDDLVNGRDIVAFPDLARRLHRIQGPLLVEGGVAPAADRSIPDPVMLPGESHSGLDELEDPALDVIEEHQVDTLNVFADGDLGDLTGVLTGTRLTGLGMGADVNIAGRLLPGGITYSGLEVLRIHLGAGDDTLTIEATHAGLTEIVGGPGDDVFQIHTIAGHTRIDGGEGDDTFYVRNPEQLLDHLEALLLLDGGEGDDVAHVDDRGSNEDELGTLTQTTLTGLSMIARAGIDRLFSISIGTTTTSFTVTLEGQGQVTFEAGASTAEIQQALQNLLFPDPDSCGTQGQSRCAQSVFVWQHGADHLVGFHGELAGDAGPTLSAIGHDGTATVQRRVDGINYYGLGELHIDLGTGDDRFNVRGTSAITYLDTGAGDDLVYVSDAADLGLLDAIVAAFLAGGAPFTAGDLEALHEQLLHGTVTVDDLAFQGTLDLIAADLHLELGAGSNTLGISDRGSDVGRADVVVTAEAISGWADGDITYRATGGDVAGQGAWTRVADLGLFGRGVNLHGGSGGNTFTVTGLAIGALEGSAFAATLTSLFSGEGDDRVRISVPDAAGRMLMVDGQGGDDVIDADPCREPASDCSLSTTTLPLVLFGGTGQDHLRGGVGDDILFGDTGRVYFLRPDDSAGFDVVLGGTPDADHLMAPDGSGTVAADSSFRTPDVALTVTSAAPDGTGLGNGDRIVGSAGNNLIFGGAGGDVIAGGAGNDLIFGDFGWVGGTLDLDALPLWLDEHPFRFLSTDVTDNRGGDDVVFGDQVRFDLSLLGVGDPLGWFPVGAYGPADGQAPGENILLGGQGDDVLFGGDGDDDIIGGHNVAGGHAGNDVIDGGLGDDVIAGDNARILRTAPGTASTRIRTLSGPSIYDPVHGHAQVDPTGRAVRHVTILDHAADTDPSHYGNDVVAGGGGDDEIFGQLGDDVLHGDGRIVFASEWTGGPLTFGPHLLTVEDGWFLYGGTRYRAFVLALEDTALDGDDYLEGGGGDNLIFGGLGQDDIVGGSSSLFGLGTSAQRPAGSNVIFGGNGDHWDRAQLHLGHEAPHARDADVILGDNGNIYRIVYDGSVLPGPGTPWYQAFLTTPEEGEYLTFNHDCFAADGTTQATTCANVLRVIPRAVDLLDYWPTGGDGGYWSSDQAVGHHPQTPTWVEDGQLAGRNLGAGDFIYAETGNNIVYGMTGDDVVYGGPGINHLYGGAGDDFVHGGTGDEGILGDDGRLLTSRNGETEPLYGLLAPNVQRVEDTPGRLQQQTVHRTGAIHHGVEFTLRVQDPQAGAGGNLGAVDGWIVLGNTFVVGGNDIIFGGGGDNHIHGGEGSDAISGTAALPLYYRANPWTVLEAIYGDFRGTPAGILRFDPLTGTFPWFNEYAPLQRIMLVWDDRGADGGAWVLDEHGGCLAANGGGPGLSSLAHVLDPQAGDCVDFLLNFTQYLDVEDDLTGATVPAGEVWAGGENAIFGGGGNDWIVGGPGRDRMYGGWGDDLINAVGDHNTNGGLNDSPPPPSSDNEDLAYGGAGRSILIADTGGDRLIDWVGSFNTYIVPFSPYGAFTISRQISPHLVEFLIAVAGSDGTDQRLGALYGELGLVTQRDPYWTDQTGAPSQPHPGNMGGRRDVLRSQDFSDTSTVSGSFAVDSGTWSLAAERYSNQGVRNEDAVALFYVDHQLPTYYEVVAVLSADRSGGGLGSNGYIVFDYQSPTDFKFAGIDTSTNVIVIGRRTANGWSVLASRNLQLLHGRDYELLLLVDGQLVTLVVDGATWVSYTFASPLIDPDDPFRGVVDPLTDGLIGVGAHASTVRLNSMAVRVLAPTITWTVTTAFDAVPDHDTVAGTWMLGTEGYTGVADGVDAAAPGALSIAGTLQLEPAAVLLLATEVRTGGVAGLAFDRDAEGRFKFVALDVVGDRILVGYWTSAGFVVQHTFARSLSDARSYDLRLVLSGNEVTVWLDDVEVGTAAFYTLLHEGSFGLLTISGSATFGSMTLATDDPAYEPPLPVLTISDVATTEGDDGTTTVLIPVDLSRASDEPVSVRFRTEDGTAIAGQDYEHTEGLLVFAPGETRRYVAVKVHGDTIPEPDETFRVVLFDAVGATVGRAVGTVTILNDDFLVTVNVATTDPVASKAGPDPGAFTVSRQADDLSGALVVRLGWSGSAVFGIDYRVTVTGGTLSASGATLTILDGHDEAVLLITPTTGAAGSSDVAVTILPDAAYQVGAASRAELVILDDLAIPQVSIGDAYHVVDGRQGWVEVLVWLDTAPTSTVRVRVVSHDGTARAGTDYRAVDEWVTFEAGQTQAVIQVRILRGAGIGTFRLSLNQPDGLALARREGTVHLVGSATAIPDTYPGDGSELLAPSGGVDDGSGAWSDGGVDHDPLEEDGTADDGTADGGTADGGTAGGAEAPADHDVSLLAPDEHVVAIHDADASDGLLLVTTTISAAKKNTAATDRWVVYDHEDADTFRYAGFDASTGQLVIGECVDGHCTELARIDAQLKGNGDHEMTVVVEGDVVTVSSPGATLVHEHG
jgi:Ca2+-binding RTX toxin-like protein